MGNGCNPLTAILNTPETGCTSFMQIKEKI
jgi:hypothetical protein